MKLFNNLKSDKAPKRTSLMKDLNDYYASENEIAEVEEAILQNGFWEENIEWRISTTTVSRIEPKTENDKKWFITTVNCEQEIKIPAATIARAIIFKKIYFDFQIELFYKQGWASWKTKSTP